MARRSTHQGTDDQVSLSRPPGQIFCVSTVISSFYCRLPFRNALTGATYDLEVSLDARIKVIKCRHVFPELVFIPLQIYAANLLIAQAALLQTRSESDQALEFQFFHHSAASLTTDGKADFVALCGFIQVCEQTMSGMM